VLNVFFDGAAAWFGVPALIGTGIFAIRMLLTLFGGHFGDLDSGGDAGHSGHADHSDPSSVFKFLTFQSIVAFAMGFGWAGLGALKGVGWGLVPSILAGVGGGMLMVWLIAILLKGVISLDASGNIAIDRAVGQEAEVYVEVPGRGSGRGQVRVVVNDRQRMFGAVSEAGVIPSRTRVRVLRANEDNTLTVEPA